MLPTYEEIIEALDYNPETGILVWKYRANVRPEVNTKCAGKVATFGAVTGRNMLQYKRTPYYSAQIIWLIMTGVWPDFPIDHKNQVNNDDRWDNMRATSASLNGANRGKNRNNTSGYKGVSWHKQMRRWRATIMVEKKQKYLGLFDTQQEAFEAYKVAATRYFGEFAAW